MARPPTGAAFVVVGIVGFTIAGEVPDPDESGAQIIEFYSDNEAVRGTQVFLIATGLAIVRYGALPRWLGWVAIAFGVAATSPIGFVSFIGIALMVPSTACCCRCGPARRGRSPPDGGGPVRACDHASMPSEAATPIWVRAVADPAFRDALIEDPLRALGEAGDVAASPEQVRQLEEMGQEERAELVMGVVREVHVRGAQARFGAIGPDGRIGGPPG